MQILQKLFKKKEKLKMEFFSNLETKEIIHQIVCFSTK